MVDRGASETADPTAADWDRQIRSQVSRIVQDISSTPPSVPHAAGSVSFEDVVGATARAVVPALLVDLPLELERLLGRVLEASGVSAAADPRPADDRVQLLRVIIARLSSEWAALAERLVERLDAILAGSGDPQSKGRVHDRIALQFHAGLLSTIVLGDAPRPGRDGSWGKASPLLSADALAERMSEFVARRLEELSGRLAENAASKAAGEHQAEGPSADELRDLLRVEIQDTLGRMPPPGFRPEEIQTIASQIVHSLGASLTAMLFGPRKGEAPRMRPKARARKPKPAAKKRRPAKKSRRIVKKRPEPVRRRRPAAKKTSARRPKVKTKPKAKANAKVKVRGR